MDAPRRCAIVECVYYGEEAIFYVNLIQLKAKKRAVEELRDANLLSNTAFSSFANYGIPLRSILN